MRNPQSSRISSLLAIPLLGRLRSGLKLLLRSQPSRRDSATATASTLRPLLPIDAANRFAGKTPIDVEWLRSLINSETYRTLVLPYFYQYPPRSLMDPDERALLYCLIRALKPENVVESAPILPARPRCWRARCGKTVPAVSTASIRTAPAVSRKP